MSKYCCPECEREEGEKHEKKCPRYKYEKFVDGRQLTFLLTKENNMFELGSVSHGTMRPQDLVPVFLRELKERDEKVYRSFVDSLGGDVDAVPIEEVERVLLAQDNELMVFTLSDLFDALNEVCPPYVYFGAHEGDGSDYGFWVDTFSLDRALLIGPNPELSSGDSLPDNPQEYEDGDLFAVISDHGNVTLWQRNSGARKWEEVWAIV